MGCRGLRSGSGVVVSAMTLSAHIRPAFLPLSPSRVSHAGSAPTARVSRGNIGMACIGLHRPELVLSSFCDTSR